MVPVALVSLGLLVLAVWWFVGAYRARQSVYELFGIDPRIYRLIATDLGGRKTVYLRHNQLVGAADALFVSRHGRDGIVGEYKSRRHRGVMRRRERYQVTLYQGMFK